jgi:ribosomal protein L37AE/L43A
MSNDGREYQRNRRSEARQLVEAAKREKPCPDCKRRYPSWCMDFDHVDGRKVCAISTMVTRGLALERLIEELAKCEVVCANCHRTRTHERRKAAGARVATD